MLINPAYFRSLLLARRFRARAFVWYPAAAFLAALLSCSEEAGLTGGTTETGNSRTALVVRGSVTDENGNPLPNIDISGRPDSFNPITSNANSLRLVTEADSDGRFILNSHFDEGIALTLTDSSTGRRAFRSVGRSPEGEVDLGSVTLSPTSHLAFRTDVSYDHFALYIPGSDRWTTLPPDQWATIDSVAYQSDYMVHLFDMESGKVLTTFESVDAGDSCSICATASGGRTIFKLRCR